MNLVVKTASTAVWGDFEMRCAVGRNGVALPSEMYEGGGRTPIGSWPMREVFYRPDRTSRPVTCLPVREIGPNDAWCDVGDDPLYNKHVQLPYVTRDERLWREDGVYDLVVVIGYNDNPVIPHKGSAIFLHLAKPDFGASAGCITLAEKDMRTVLREAEPTSCVIVRPF